ncbi:MAG: DUF4493 domain-containing protein [Bacteroidota bacterium]
MHSKNLFQWLLFASLLISFIACEKAETVHPSEPATGKLSLRIDGNFTIEKEHSSGRRAAVLPDNFKVIIYDGNAQEVKAYEKYSLVPAEIVLPVGEYSVVAHSNNLELAAFDNPYYAGKTSAVKVLKDSTQAVKVNCELGNVKITIAYTDAIKTNCTAYSTVVKTDSASLTFSQTETRAGYFKTAPLFIVSTLTYLDSDGTTRTRTLRGTIPNPAPKDYYKITIKDTLSTGIVKTLDIVVDETTTQKEMIVDSEGTPPWQPGAAWADTRDGQIYKTLQFGNQVWMTENFNYEILDSWRHASVQVGSEKKYGRLYTCSAAVAGAPAGWHLPSREEWKILEDYFKLNKLTGLETTGFNGILGGGYSVTDNLFYGFKEFTYYKSTSGNVFPCYTTNCGGIYSQGYSCESYAFSVRYIKN